MASGAGKIGRLLAGPVPDEGADAAEEAEMDDEERATSKADAGLALKSALAGGDGAAIAEAFEALSSLVGG